MPLSVRAIGRSRGDFLVILEDARICEESERAGWRRVKLNVPFAGIVAPLESEAIDVQAQNRTIQGRRQCQRESVVNDERSD